MQLTFPILTTCLLLSAQASSADATESRSEAKTAEGKPNVLLIIADDLGLQLSCYGDEHIQTPNIDALAGSGMRFRTAYVAQASCSPSRSAIYTGLFPHTNGHLGLAKPNNPPLREEYRTQTLPALMKAAGYRTGIVGKLHVNPKSAFPFDLNRNADLGPNGAREVREMAKATKNPSVRRCSLICGHSVSGSSARCSRACR